MFNPFLPNASLCRSLSLIPNWKTWAPEGMQEISQHRVFGEGMEVIMKRNGLLFTSQERQVLCFWSVMLSTWWQINFIWWKYEIAYQLAITSWPNKKSRWQREDAMGQWMDLNSTPDPNACQLSATRQT